MPDFTKPLFARGNQVVTLLQECRAAGYRCVKLECLKGSMYRAHFAEEKILKENVCITSHHPIQINPQ